MLNKPFGGKMNFTPHSFTWLIENTLTRNNSLLLKKKDSLQITKVNSESREK